MFKKHRIISEGQLPNSQHGIFNPGAVQCPLIKSDRNLLLRQDTTRGYSNDCNTVLVVDKIEKLKHGEVDNYYYLTKEGFPKGKIEDFRLFHFRGELYAIHTLVVTKDLLMNAEVIKPVISKVTRSTITMVDYVELPGITKKQWEKNWMPIVWKDDLYIIYGLDPLIIYKLQGWSWMQVMEVDTGLIAQVKQWHPKASFLSLSATHLFEGNQVLGFWHIRENDIYYQGMFALDMETLKITHFTPPVIDGTDAEGYKAGCLYVNDLVVTDNNVEVWCGEGDSHTTMLEAPKNYVAQKLSEHPYNYTAPLKIKLLDNGVGDFICAMYAINGWLRDNPTRKIKLYLLANRQIATILNIPRVEIWNWSGQRVDLDLSSNQDNIPFRDRKIYHEKVKGSFKEWYSKTLGTTPEDIKVDHIEPLQGYENAIVLFPFAAHPERCWPKERWIELATQLIASNQRVIISDPFPERCKDFPGEHLLGTSMREVLGLIKTAKLTVSNESGAAHMGGLFESKTLVLSGWLDPAKINDRTNNDYIFKPSLKLIEVEEVYNKIIGLIK